MSQEQNRRSFLKALGAIALYFAIPDPVCAGTLTTTKKEGLEVRLNRSLTPKIRAIIPRNLDLKVLEGIEIKEAGTVSTTGRFLRTYRWDNLLSCYQHTKYIEPGLLAGIVMHESYGNPLMRGPTKDAGLWMFIPDTARGYGLKVTADMDSLINQWGGNYQRLAEADERFDVFKSTDAAVRYLLALRAKLSPSSKGTDKGSWDHVLSAYNQASPAAYPESTKYVREVRFWQDYYLRQLNFIKGLRSGKINAKTVDQLIRLNQNDFRLENSQFHYTVVEGDVPNAIAERFNAKFGGTYQRINSKGIFYDGKQVDPQKIVPCQDLYWAAVSKKKR